MSHENNMDTKIQNIRQERTDISDPKHKKTGQRFYKEEVKLYGIKTAIVTQIAKKYYAQIKNSDKAEIFELCEILWQSGYIEESVIACNWAYAIRYAFEPDDFRVFEKWVHRYAGNWVS